MYDGDADLLARAAGAAPNNASDGSAVTVETRGRDITWLHPSEMAGATLITASALLDVMSREGLKRLIATCTGPRCPVLITLSVTGRVDLTPSDPFDTTVAEASNATSDVRSAPDSCSAPTRSAQPSTASRGWDSTSWFDQAHGSSAPTRLIWRPSGSPVGWPRHASSDRN